MKVLAAVVLAPHWVVSGAATAAMRLSEALAEACDIELVRMGPADTTEHVGRLKVTGVRCSNPLRAGRAVLPSHLYTQFFRSSIPARVSQAGVDLVHLHNPIPTLELRRIATACLRARLPYVISTHGFVEVASQGAAYGLRGPARLAWHLLVDGPFRWVVRHATRVLALSPADMAVLDALAFPRSRVAIVPNGVDMPEERPRDEDEVARVCRKYGVPFPKPTGTPVGMFLGNHTRNKGVLVLLDAFRAYPAPFRLIVAGGHRPYIDYDGYAAGLRPGQHAHFPGVISEDEKKALFRYADVFIFPTRADTFPLSVLEAMAHGLPVLATRVGGIPYQVDEQCGRLVAPDDPAALRDAFADLARNAATMRAMGEAARRRAAADFDWASAARKALAAYRSIA
jgi:alpha-maltose-1-phosphate synthase